MAQEAINEQKQALEHQISNSQRRNSITKKEIEQAFKKIVLKVLKCNHFSKN